MTEPAASPQKTRVRVFIDYWNFQLSLNAKEARKRGVPDYRFRVDWPRVGPLLASKACEAAGIPTSGHAFEGVIIYASYDPTTDKGKKFNKWATTWLDRQPGIQVECRPRSPKRPPKCPSCYREIEYCPLPGCGQKIVATVEKGVDTLIVTDMIRLAWENAYDLAVLATSDADLVPAVEFLNLKARRVIQAGFPPLGTSLATACWASFNTFDLRDQLERP